MVDKGETSKWAGKTLEEIDINGECNLRFSLVNYLKITNSVGKVSAHSNWNYTKKKEEIKRYVC